MLQATSADSALLTMGLKFVWDKVCSFEPYFKANFTPKGPVLLCDIEEFSAAAIRIQALEPTADVFDKRHFNKEFSTRAIC